MNIFQIIAEQIATQVGETAYTWSEVLGNTNPGNYGNLEWDVEIDPKDIWVDIQELTFMISKGKFMTTVILGASNDGVNAPYNKYFRGSGKFVFISGNQIQIKDDVIITINPDIYIKDF